MCFERLIKLKCGHYESYLFDECNTKSRRACKKYKQAVVREDKGGAAGSAKHAWRRILEWQARLGRRSDARLDNEEGVRLRWELGGVWLEPMLLDAGKYGFG